MGWFRDAKLSAKIGGGIGLIVLLLLVVAGTTTFGMGKIHHRSDICLRANDSLEMLLQARRHEKNFIIRGDDEYRRKTLDSVESGVASMAALKAEFEDPADVAQADRVIGGLDGYRAAFEQFVRHKRSADADGAEMERLDKAMVASARAAETEIKAMIRLQTDGMQSDRQRATAVAWSIALACAVMGGLLAIALTRGIVGPIRRSVALARDIASGDLSRRLEVDRKDEVGQLVSALGAMTEKLRSTVAAVQSAADNVASGSMQLSSTAQQMSEGATEQAASIEEVSASIEEMTASIQSNTDNSRQTERIAAQAADRSAEGGKAVLRSVEAMRQIADRIAIIEEIARRTDLLALNAAIEAARAGDAGRGFAVVALEVRKLAERSQAAAAEITALSDSSVRVAETAGRVLDTLVPEIQHTSSLVQAIAVASTEQATGAVEVGKAIQQLDAVIQQNASASEQMAATSEELAGQAEQMRDAVSFFRLDAAPARSGALGSRELRPSLHARLAAAQ